MTSLFQGVAQAKHYAAFRPTYPKALYELIASQCRTNNKNNNNKDGTKQCIDVGCGTGQATVQLADYFESVIGVDPSLTQLEQATKDPKVTYHNGKVEEYLSSLPADQSIDCITAAQAVHWFDIPQFYRQVHRLLPQGGVLAIWTYGLSKFPHHPILEQQLDYIYNDILGDYWDPRKQLVDDLYRNVPLIDEFFPDDFQHGQRLQDMDELNIRQDISGYALKGYLRSWSGYAKYCREHKITPGSSQDPVETIIRKGLADHDTTLCQWPVAMLISRKRQEGSVNEMVF